MNAKKFLAALSIIVVLSAVGFAASSSTDSESVIYPYPYYYGDVYPNVLVLKGVAVDNKIEPAVFVGIGEKIENSFLIIGDKAYELELKDYNYDSEKQTLVATFESGEETLKIVVKHYTVNYNSIVVASGTFDGKILNMKLVGEEPIYKILEQPSETIEMTKTKATEIAKQLEKEE